MMPFNALYLAFIIVGVLSFACLIFSGDFIYKKSKKEKFRYYHNFPYEIDLELNKREKLPYRIFLIIYLISSFLPLSLIVSSYTIFSKYAPFYLITSLILIVPYFMYWILTILPAKFIRQHTLVFAIFLAMTFVVACLVSVLAFLLFGLDCSILHLLIGVFAVAIALFILIIAVNPKLKNWTKLETKVTKDGTKEIVRPKYFPLAYSQWLILLSLEATTILLYLTILSI